MSNSVQVSHDRGKEDEMRSWLTPICPTEQNIVFAEEMTALALFVQSEAFFVVHIDWSLGELCRRR